MPRDDDGRDDHVDLGSLGWIVSALIVAIGVAAVVLAVLIDPAAWFLVPVLVAILLLWNHMVG